MPHYILSIDAGTTGVQAALFDVTDLTMYGNNKISFFQHFPQPGYVEHDPNEIWKATCQAIQNACVQAESEIKNFSTAHICAIGIANQRETCLGWNLRTCASPFRAIVWQDRRTAETCESMKKDKKLRNKIQKTTGLVCDPYFSATKMQWLLQNNDTLRKWAREKKLALGTIDSFLAWKLSDHKEFVTDHTNASRTMLYNLHTGDYDDDLLNFFNIPREALPKILPSIGIFGKIKNHTYLPDGIPIHSMLGDQQAALYGQQCTKKGNSKITFGTGAFILMNTGPKIISSSHGLLTTVALSTAHNRTFALEGSTFIAGAAVQFLRDNFKWFKKSDDIEKLALLDSRDDGVIFILALAGLGAPFWNSQAKGALLGLTRGTTKSQIARAVLESIALQNVSLMEIIQKESEIKISKLCVDGGGSANQFMMQFQADVLRIKLARPHNFQTTLVGVALAVYEAIHNKPACYNPKETTFTPKMKLKEATTITKKWLAAADCINKFYL